MCIVRLQFRKTREPLYDFICMARRTVVGLGQEEIANRIRGTEISCSQKRFDCIFIVAARVQRDAKTDRHPRRIRVTLRRLAEELNGGLKRPMQKKLTGPVEKITLARILMSCNLKLIHRRYEVPILLFDLAQQIVHFSSIFLLQKALDQVARWNRLAREQIGQCEVVAIVVGGRIGLLCLLEKRNCFRKFSNPHV